MGAEASVCHHVVNRDVVGAAVHVEALVHNIVNSVAFHENARDLLVHVYENTATLFA